MTVEHGADISVYQTFNAVESVFTISYLKQEAGPLTYAHCVALGNDFVLDVLPELNLVQHEGILNTKLRVQARGTVTPVADIGLSGGGGYAAGSTLRMIPSMSFWYRFVVGATVISVNGDPDVAHPIRWGGIHIPGCTEDYWDGGNFVFPTGQDDAFADLETALTTSLTDGTNTFDHMVLGEEIVAGTGWRAALVEGYVINRIGELKSRRA